METSNFKEEFERMLMSEIIPLKRGETNSPEGGELFSKLHDLVAKMYLQNYIDIGTVKNIIWIHLEMMKYMPVILVILMIRLILWFATRKRRY